MSDDNSNWKDLTDEEIHAAWQLCEEASEGHWEFEEDDPYGMIEDKDGYGICQIQHHGSLNSVMRTGEQYSHADARFIAASRDVLPRALQMVRRLQEENKRLQALFEDRKNLHHLELERARKAEGELFYKTLSEVTERVELDHEVNRLQEALDGVHPDPWYNENGCVWSDHGDGNGLDLICRIEPFENRQYQHAQFMTEARNVLPKLLTRLRRPVYRDDLIKRLVGDPDFPAVVYLRDGTKIAVRRDKHRAWLGIERQPTVHLCEGDQPDGDIHPPDEDQRE